MLITIRNKTQQRIEENILTKIPSIIGDSENNG